MSKIIAIYEDVARLVVGEVVEETPEFYKLKNPVIAMAKSPQPGQFQTEFIPYEMVSVEPQPLPLRAMCEETYDGIITFQKKELRMDNVPLRADLLDGYKQKIAGQPVQKAPEKNIVKLF